jgi:predicted RNA-binding protein with PUA-like domain
LGQADVGELCDSRDGIRNQLELLGFFDLSTGVEFRLIDGLTRLTGELSKSSRKETNCVAHWLMKSEPESYSWTDLVRDGSTEWDGVRNNAARLHLKAMKAGETAFFYHSMSEKAVVGIMRISREAQPDLKDPNWVSVRVEPVKAIGPVTLADIKAQPRLAKMELIRQSRLSVAPVRDDEWATLLEMAQAASS